MKNLSSLSIFFPALNDAKSLPDLIEKATKTAENFTSDFEILVIDNGSSDETREVLDKLKNTNKNLHPLYFDKALGYGGALSEGFKNSKKDWVFYTDSDGQYDPSELTLLINKLDEKIDVVNGYKINRSDSIARKIVGGIYNSTMHVLYSLPIRDVDCDFRLINNKLAKKIKLEAKSGLVCLELVVKLKEKGARFVEVPVHHYPRKHGKSTVLNVGHLSFALFEHLKFYLKK